MAWAKPSVCEAAAAARQVNDNAEYHGDHHLSSDAVDRDLRAFRSKDVCGCWDGPEHLTGQRTRRGLMVRLQCPNLGQHVSRTNSPGLPLTVRLCCRWRATRQPRSYGNYRSMALFPPPSFQTISMENPSSSTSLIACRDSSPVPVRSGTIRLPDRTCPIRG
jgi:hypothetical protein